MHVLIKEANDTYVDLDYDRVNRFERVENLLLHKKLENFESLLDIAVEAGGFV